MNKLKQIPFFSENEKQPETDEWSGPDDECPTEIRQSKRRDAVSVQLRPGKRRTITPERVLMVDALFGAGFVVGVAWPCCRKDIGQCDLDTDLLPDPLLQDGCSGEHCQVVGAEQSTCVCGWD